jgi:hypothetical protein
MLKMQQKIQILRMVYGHKEALYHRVLIVEMALIKMKIYQ